MAVRNVLIGWLDLGDEDQARARDYLAWFRPEGTVDELGFGIMRDALADEFFPATNTDHDPQPVSGVHPPRSTYSWNESDFLVRERPIE